MTTTRGRRSTPGRAELYIVVGKERATWFVSWRAAGPRNAGVDVEL
jgi:hypothetical protein